MDASGLLSYSKNPKILTGFPFNFVNFTPSCKHLVRTFQTRPIEKNCISLRNLWPSGNFSNWWECREWDKLAKPITRITLSVKIACNDTLRVTRFRSEIFSHPLFVYDENCEQISMKVFHITLSPTKNKSPYLLR